jgi:aspartyl-tRNA(Asn)/glutamyl-tRNA(Gln) amidotransferase subunit A
VTQRPLFERVDIVLTPASATVAPTVEEADAASLERWTTANTRHPWSTAGVPALVIPCGLHDGLPVGLQIVARRWRDETALRAGAAYQAATAWHTRRPVLQPAIGFSDRLP